MEHCNTDRDLNLALVCSPVIIFVIGNAVAKRNRPVMRSISSNGPGQTVQTQIRCCSARRLIIVYTIPQSYTVSLIVAFGKLFL